MTLPGLQLTAGLVALATSALVACGDEGPSVTDEAPYVAPSTDAPLDPAATPTPPNPIPSAPPEIIAPADGAPPLDSSDPAAPSPADPPPVLPESPPN